MTTTPTTPAANPAAAMDAIIQAAYAKEGNPAAPSAPATPTYADFLPQAAPVAPTQTAPTPTALPVAVPAAAPVAPALAAPSVAAPVAAPALAAPTAVAPAVATPTMTITQAAEIVPVNATPAQIAQLAKMAGTDQTTLNAFIAMRNQYTSEGKTPNPVSPSPVTPAPTPTAAPAQTADPVAAQVAVASLYQSIGGAAAWNDFAGYMSTAADPATLAAYQAASPADAVRIAQVYVEGFKANPTRRDVTQGNPVGGPTPAPTGPANEAAIKAMFADPRYATDPAFRAQAQSAFVATLQG